VLVVDDDESGSAATAVILAHGGYASTRESDGDAVLRLARSDVLRLVVSELYIPCAEGRCVITALKLDRRRLPRLMVLAYSRHTAPADDQWALSAGCDSLLHKPAPAADLIREVRRLDGRDDDGPSRGPARDERDA
jgi:CheY-like chemotaxis protein